MPDPENKLKIIMSWAIIIVLSVFGTFLIIKLPSLSNEGKNLWTTLIETQFPVFVGLPMAGLASMFITLVLRISSGPIEFEATGLKFKGASAPIVFWILCFIVMSLMIKMLWVE